MNNRNKFDVKVIKQYEITLFEPQIDLIMECITFYIYHVYCLNEKSKTEEENNIRERYSNTWNLLNSYKSNKNVNSNKDKVKNIFKNFA